MNIRCEAEIVLGDDHAVTCGQMPVQLHHMLTRARGGLLLDKVGETYHHIRLCARCHTLAHDDPSAGLLIFGYVKSGIDGSPVYYGTDEYLMEKYGPC